MVYQSMKSLSFSFWQSQRFIVPVLLTVWLVSACSGANDSLSDSESNSDTAGVLGDGDETTEDSDNSNNAEEPAAVSDSTDAVTKQIEFRITVPAYQSNALQVQLDWGNITLNAIWNSDELWTVSGEFPVNAEDLLIITFYDANGDIVIGTVEEEFATGSAENSVVQINAAQFNTDIWDDDNDGISNFDELNAGTYGVENEPLNPVEVDIEFVADKTFRISWQPIGSATHYRVLENADGVSGYVSVSEDLPSSTSSFEHRVALYSRLNASYIVQACNALSCEDSEAVFVTGALETSVGYFKASNSESEDYFGVSISLNADGTTMAIGTAREESGATGVNGDQTDNTAPDAGAVYVFARNDGNWQQEAYLKASNAEARDFFYRLSLSADGNTLAVGATGEDSASTGVNGIESDNTAIDSGAVYIFTRNNGSWSQDAYLTASNSEAGDNFGSVSLSSDGNTLAVGARAEQSSATGINADQLDNSADSSGAVYIFERVNGGWQQQAYLKSSNTEAADQFGNSLSLDANGSVLAVGASEEDSASVGINGDQSSNTALSSGAAYLFLRINGNWQQQAYLKASNAGVLDGFGANISLSGDASTLAVAASSEQSSATGIDGNQNDNSKSYSGAVYVFAIDDAGNPQQQAYLKASNADEQAYFGGSVNLSHKGDILVVGSTGDDTFGRGVYSNVPIDTIRSKSGAAYVFLRSNGQWRQHAYLKASNANNRDLFGRTVSISEDGETIAVSATFEESLATGINGDQSDNSVDNTLEGVGAVYLY